MNFLPMTSDLSENWQPVSSEVSSFVENGPTHKELVLSAELLSDVSGEDDESDYEESESS